jgi:hypothetical protein
LIEGCCCDLLAGLSAEVGMGREMLLGFCEFLAEEGVIVEDGSWPQRFVDRLLDPEQPAGVGVEAVSDDEVDDPHPVLMALHLVEAVPRAAVATALRKLWLEGGVFSPEAGQISDLFRGAMKAPESLMTPAEITALANLPERVHVFRGQLDGDSPDRPSGMSWTLVEEVADWYAAPIPGQTERGHVLSAFVPRGAMLALFLARGETEVVVDLVAFHGVTVSSRKGRSDKFPAHLAAGRSLFL